MAAVIGTQPVGQRKTKGALILNALATLLVFNLSDPLTIL